METLKHGQRLLHVNEAYFMEANRVIGWTPINKNMSVNKLNKMFKEGVITSVNLRYPGAPHGRDFSYQTFRMKYPTLETYFEMLIEDIILKVNCNAGLCISQEDINFVVEDIKEKDWIGYFIEPNKIAIDRNYLIGGFNGTITEDEMLSSLLHEVGHYVHYNLFNDVQFRFPTKYKSEYAYTNYYENFAEAFCDYTLRRDKPERNNRMKEILSRVIGGVKMENNATHTVKESSLVHGKRKQTFNTIGSLIRYIKKEFSSDINDYLSCDDSSFCEVMSPECLDLIREHTNLYRLSHKEYCYLTDYNYGSYAYCKSKEELKYYVLMDYIECKIAYPDKYRSITQFKNEIVDYCKVDY